MTVDETEFKNETRCLCEITMQSYVGSCAAACGHFDLSGKDGVSCRGHVPDSGRFQGRER